MLLAHCTGRRGLKPSSIERNKPLASLVNCYHDLSILPGLEDHLWPARHAVDLEKNSPAVPSAVVTLGRPGPKKSISFYRVEGIITKVRDLKNQHLHFVATLSVLSMFIFPREGDQRSRSRSQPSCSWEGACGGEGPLFVSSNGARVESAPRFSFLTMYDLLINRRFPNNHSFNEKPALVSSWITLSSRSGPLFFPPLAWRKGPFH